MSGSYSSVEGTITGVGFKYGLSQGSLTSSKAGTYSNGSISASLSGLTAGTTYYYQVYITVKGTGDYALQSKTFTGEVKSFTTSENLSPKGWLELPAKKSTTSHFYDNFGTGKGRNYSYCYDKDRYATLWTAYPLTRAHTQGDGHTSSWRWNPNLQQSEQVNVKTNGYEINYNNGTYARGHMCPNADRKSDDAQNEQTYYVTNQLPQIQNGFNSGIWSNLENAVRGLLPSTSKDTVYVAVGPCYRKVGGSETISHLTAKEGINPSTVDIPNYFYKVLLKVKWNGGAISSACAVGFWFEHKVYSSSTFTSYAVSVDQIEAWTGFDFFANLPSSIASTAETNTSWQDFSNF